MELDANRSVSNYGNSAEETRNVRESCGLFDLSSWAKIVLTGPERRDFLHGMVSNEIKQLPNNRCNHNLILTPQGKVIAEVFVFQRDEEILILGQPDLRESIHITLDKYLIMEEAEIHDHTEDYRLFSLQGPLSSKIVNQLFPEASSLEAMQFVETQFQEAPIMMACMSHTGESGFDLLVKPEVAQNLWETLMQAGAKPVGMEAFETLRIESGIPRCGKELDTTVIPQEAHLDDCISYEKGCYIGQETVARLHFRGHVNRELTAFVLDAQEPPNEVVELELEGKKVGKITSSAYSPTLKKIIGLGFLRCKHRDIGREIETTHNGQPMIVTIAEKPLVQPKNK